MELHNMEIALHKFQDIFDSIGHEVIKRSSPVSNSQDVTEDVNREKLESIPGSQCEPANEHTVIPVFDEAATTPNIEGQSEIDPGRKQVQSQSSLMASIHMIISIFWQCYYSPIFIVLSDFST
jgi:hypothetical protein